MILAANNEYIMKKTNNFQKLVNLALKLPLDKGLLVGIYIGLVMSILFWISYILSSLFFIELSGFMSWISFLVEDIILEPLRVNSLFGVITVDTVITMAIFGLIGYLLNRIRLKNKRLFNVLIIIIVIFYILLLMSFSSLVTNNL